MTQQEPCWVATKGDRLVHWKVPVSTLLPCALPTTFSHPQNPPSGAVDNGTSVNAGVGAGDGSNVLISGARLLNTS